jgi:hypothetical protein
MQRRRRRDPRESVVVRDDSPHQRAARRVDGIDGPLQVAEVRRGPASRRPDHDGAAYAGRRLERPVNATGLGIDGIDVSRIGADEHASARDGGLAVDRRGARYAERPLQA